MLIRCVSRYKIGLNGVMVVVNGLIQMRGACHPSTKLCEKPARDISYSRTFHLSRRDLYCLQLGRMLLAPSRTLLTLKLLKD